MKCAACAVILSWSGRFFIFPAAGLHAANTTGDRPHYGQIQQLAALCFDADSVKDVFGPSESLYLYFHVTTAYATLRHNGVEVGKKDYSGALPFISAKA